MKKLLILFLLFLISCNGSSSPPPSDGTAQVLTPAYLEGIYSLSTFDAKRAVTNLREAVKNDPGDCKSYTALVMADFQMLTYEFNIFYGMILGLASGSSGAPSYQFKTQASSDIEGFDFNTIVYNILTTVDEYMIEMNKTAKILESLALSKGWEACTVNMAIPISEEDEKLLKIDRYYKLRIGGNYDGAPLELNLGPLFDEVEVRALTTFSDSIQGLMYFIVAHDLTFTLNLVKLTRLASIFADSVDSNTGSLTSILNLNLGTCDYNFSDGGVANLANYGGFINHSDSDNLLFKLYEDNNSSNPVPGGTDKLFSTQTNDKDDCNQAYIYLMQGGISSYVTVLRKLSFLLNDNPVFFAKNVSSPVPGTGDRWNRYFHLVDNSFGDGFAHISGIFDAMLRRITGIENSKIYTNEDLDKFFILVHEGGESDGKIGDGDNIGININPDFIKINISDDPKKNSDYEGYAMLGQSLISNLPVNDSQVQGLIYLFETLRDNFKAVDDTTLTYSPLKLSDFNAVLEFFGAFLSGKFPDTIEFDIPKYFTNPKPLREYFPVYIDHHDSIMELLNPDFPTEFLIEPEWRSDVSTTKPALPTEGLNGLFKLNALNEIILKNYSNIDTNITMNYIKPLSSLLSYYGKSEINFRDYDQIGDTTHFNGTYKLNGKSISVQNTLPDCVNETTLETKTVSVGGYTLNFPSEIIPYIAFKDPSFNGMLLINISPLSGLYTSGCAGDNNYPGYQVADNYLINKEINLLLYYIIDKWGIDKLLDAIPGSKK